MKVPCEQCQASTKPEFDNEVLWVLLTQMYGLMGFRCKAAVCGHVTQVKVKIRMVGDRPRIESVQE